MDTKRDEVPEHHSEVGCTRRRKLRNGRGHKCPIMQIRNEFRNGVRIRTRKKRRIDRAEGNRGKTGGKPEVLGTGYIGEGTSGRGDGIKGDIGGQYGERLIRASGALNKCGGKGAGDTGTIDPEDRLGSGMGQGTSRMSMGACGAGCGATEHMVNGACAEENGGSTGSEDNPADPKRKERKKKTSPRTA